MKKYIVLLIAFGSITAIFTKVSAQQNLYVPDKKITIPGNGGYDYLFIDEQARKLYVSHGTAINVINLDTEELMGTIENLQGDHGVAVVPGAGKGFISDGKANAVVAFDLVTLKIIKIIPLTGKKPDAIIYDVFSNRIFAFNGGSDNASVIDINSLTETNLIALDGAPEFAVTDEQGKLYVNLEDKNSLKVIDTKNLKATNTHSLTPCGGPTGLAIDTSNKRLFTVCRENKGMSVVDITSGKIIATIRIGAGVDAVAYDAATNLIFCSNGDATTTIIKQETADKYAVVQTLKTQIRAKTLALDNKTHKIYLSVADFMPGTKNTVANSFKVLVYKMAK